jgi:hypothetical protein
MTNAAGGQRVLFARRCPLAFLTYIDKELVLLSFLKPRPVLMRAFNQISSLLRGAAWTRRSPAIAAISGSRNPSPQPLSDSGPVGVPSRPIAADGSQLLCSVFILE